MNTIVIMIIVIITATFLGLTVAWAYELLRHIKIIVTNTSGIGKASCTACHLIATQQKNTDPNVCAQYC